MLEQVLCRLEGYVMAFAGNKNAQRICACVPCSLGLPLFALSFGCVWWDIHSHAISTTYW